MKQFLRIQFSRSTTGKNRVTVTTSQHFHLTHFLVTCERRRQGGEADMESRRFAALTLIALSGFHTAGITFCTTIYPQLVRRAVFFVFLHFVALAQHLTDLVHFNAKLFSLLLDNSFIVGAFFLPAKD